MESSERSLGASQTAIEFHYDVGNEFYQLWLGRTMMYSCALWDLTVAPDALSEAQTLKIDWHLQQACVVQQPRVLDVGCGWGTTLQHLVDRHAVQHAVGLTLSPSQTEWINQLNHPRIEVRVENWADHRPDKPYDAIVSIEAFEAFARPEHSSDEKIQRYRQFFKTCHDWLRPGGCLSLQTIAYGNSSPKDLDQFIADDIFPESDLPRLAEIIMATEHLFEVVTLQNDRHHYVQTLRAWLDNLKGNRKEAIAQVGEDTVDRYIRYLRLSIFMFSTGACDLHRIALRRIDHPRD